MMNRFCLLLPYCLLLAACGCGAPGYAKITTPLVPTPPGVVTGPTPHVVPSGNHDPNFELVGWTEPRACTDKSTSACSQGGNDWGASPRDVFRHDRQDFFPMLARDTRGLVNWRDLGLLGASLGGAIAVREEWDDDVRDYTADHPERWGGASDALGKLGEFQYQIPVMFGVYGYSLYSENEELHSLTKSIISAYTISSLTTLGVKLIADTDRPSREWNDGRFGFPSYHTSSSFAIAAVVEEYEGFAVALPAYGLAGVIAWSRIDQRDHDLSDVLFGGALGYIIGKSVAKQHKHRDTRMRLQPYAHPLEPAAGLAAEWQY